MAPFIIAGEEVTVEWRDIRILIGKNKFFSPQTERLDVHHVSVTDPGCRSVNPLITRSRNLSTGNTLYFSSKD